MQTGQLQSLLRKKKPTTKPYQPTGSQIPLTGHLFWSLVPHQVLIFGIQKSYIIHVHVANSISEF